MKFLHRSRKNSVSKTKKNDDTKILRRIFFMYDEFFLHRSAEKFSSAKTKKNDEPKIPRGKFRIVVVI